MSSNNIYNLEVDICGQKLTLNSDVSEEHISKVSSYVDKTLREVKLNNKSSTNKSMGIMLGLTIADEFFIYKKNAEDEIRNLKKEVENTKNFYSSKLSAKEKEFVKYIDNISEIESENEKHQETSASLALIVDNLESEVTELVEEISLLKEVNELLRKENEQLKNHKNIKNNVNNNKNNLSTNAPVVNYNKKPNSGANNHKK